MKQILSRVKTSYPFLCKFLESVKHEFLDLPNGPNQMMLHVTNHQTQDNLGTHDALLEMSEHQQHRASHFYVNSLENDVLTEFAKVSLGREDHSWAGKGGWGVSVWGKKE